MIQTVLASLNPILTLFICIAVGFAAQKLKILPDTSSAVLAKVQTFIICPALSFITMARYFTLPRLGEYSKNVTVSTVFVFLTIGVGILLSRLLVRKKCYERNVFAYALAFCNTGYFGEPVVLALFGEEILAHYKFFCLPISIGIYTWGLTILAPGGKGGYLKKILNAPTVATLLGMAAGLIFPNFDAACPSAIVNALDTLKVCMAPVAMLIAGITIAKYDIPAMLKKGRVYIATLLRLVILPALFIPLIWCFKELLNSLFDFGMNNDVLYLTFFAVAGPLGLNTVVFPEAYGENPETGASMAMISHTLCIISIPILLYIVELLFGKASFMV